MKYSVVLNGIDSAYVLKKYLEEKSGYELLFNTLKEQQGIKSTSKFLFDIGLNDHKKVYDIILQAGLPLAVADSLREEVSSGYESEL